MSKAIAPHTLFIIATIAFFLLFIFGLFFQWIETNNIASNQATCTIKKISFCSEWTRAKKHQKQSIGKINLQIVVQDQVVMIVRNLHQLYHAIHSRHQAAASNINYSENEITL